MTDTAERPITREDFDELDLVALDKAIELTLADDDDPDRVKQVRDKSIEDG